MQIIQILNVIGPPLLFLIMFVMAYKILCFILALFLLSFGVYIFISLLFFNTRTIVKRESSGDLSYRLTLAFAVGLILLIIIHKLMNILDLPQILRSLFISIDIVIFYYFFHMSQYILTTFFCNLSHPKKNKDYIIVLGCGLKDGNVTTLLAKRVEKAIQFYNKQKLKTKPPKLVFSGGQGADEPRSESEAMAEYAISKGASKEDFILESKSTSTEENMNFSKKLMDEDSKGEKYNAIYVTSNFHILRAGIYAHKAGLKINGIGSKTAFYYFPNAILREYAAYLFMYMKWNIGLTIFMIVFGTVSNF